MSRRKLVATALALGLAAATFQPAAGFAQQASVTGGPAALVPADLEFVLKAANDGLAEVALGRLAQVRAGAEEVKAFARHMVEDHARANDELAQIAIARGTLPPKLPSESAQALEKTLAAYVGEQFDEVYVPQQVGAHVVALALFQHASQHADSPELQEFAKKYTPVIEEHLRQAQELMKKMGGKS